MKDPVREKIERYELTRTIDPAHFFRTLDEAVAEYMRQTVLPGGARGRRHDHHARRLAISISAARLAGSAAAAGQRSLAYLLADEPEVPGQGAQAVPAHDLFQQRDVGPIVLQPRPPPAQPRTHAHACRASLTFHRVRIGPPAPPTANSSPSLKRDQDQAKDHGKTTSHGTNSVSGLGVHDQ